MPRPNAEWVKKYGHNWERVKVQLKPNIPDVTARHISISKDFVAGCAHFNVKPTIRQARKYRAKIGKWSDYRPGENANV